MISFAMMLLAAEPAAQAPLQAVKPEPSAPDSQTIAVERTRRIAESLQNSIEIPTRAGRSPNVVYKIAKFGQPETVTVAAGQSIAAAVEQRCGDVDPVYLDWLIAYNKGLVNKKVYTQKLRYSTRVVFPACVRINGPIEDLSAGSPSQNLAAQQSPAVIPDTQQIIPLRPGLPRTKVVSEINEGQKASDRAAEALAADPISDDAVESRTCIASANSWPFNLNDLFQSIENSRADTGDKLAEATTILIVDTGFNSELINKKGFPRRYVAQLQTIDGSAWVDGLNMLQPNSGPMPPADLINRWHGVEVGEVALGSVQLEPIRDAMEAPIRVAFASATLRTGGAAYMDPNALLHALDYAGARGIKIVNVSMDSASDSSGFESKLTNTGSHVLIVAAAGNDGLDLDQQAMRWPSSYGGDVRNSHGGLVITVGAHDQAGNRLNSSQFGATRVDILAPGCRIPTRTITGEHVLRTSRVEHSGTSFAAPLVSYVAANLASAGVTLENIKIRVLISADVSKTLSRQSFSRGKLNAAKALSIHKDVVEFVGANGRPTTIYGEVRNPQDIVKVCGQELPLHRLLKLSFTDRDTAGVAMANIWLRAPDGRSPLEFQRLDLCQEAPDPQFKLLVEDSETGGTLSVSFAQLIDFAPRLGFGSAKGRSGNLPTPATSVANTAQPGETPR